VLLCDLFVFWKKKKGHEKEGGGKKKKPRGGVCGCMPGREGCDWVVGAEVFSPLHLSVLNMELRSILPAFVV
jgi:hypothetical protein